MEESDYKLIRQAGAGISGAVWSADGPAGRVAMRRFASPAAQGGPDWLADRAQFLQGGRQSLTLRNPRIVSVLDVIDDGSNAWIAAEFVSSETLEAVLKRERLPVEQTSYMLRLMALTLDHAHRAGVTHGDMKPSNVFVGEKRSIRIADFGISPRARKTPRSSTPAAWGHAYLSPEHFIAPASLGPQSDQYALAAMAYHMYTGKAPFAAIGGDPGPAILRGQVAPPSSVDRNLPVGLDVPILRALSRDPGQRFSSCIEFVEQVEAGLVPVAGASPAKAGSSPRLMYAGLASLLVALGIVAILAMSGGKPKPANEQKPAPPAQTAAATPGAPVATGTTAAVAAPAKPKQPKAANPSTVAAVAPSRPKIVAQADPPAPAQPRPRVQPAADPGYIPTRYPTGGSSPVAENYPRGNSMPVRPAAPAPAAEPLAPLMAPEGAPKGYSLAIYSRNKPIGNGISFSYKDPSLGEMGAGDLRAQVRLNGPAGKGRLSVEWTVDGTIMDARLVNPNTMTEFHNEPVPGTYRVILRQDSKTVAEYTFRITPP